jgi:hypothetical protein
MRSPQGSGYLVGTWIDLTDHDGPTVVVNVDNVTYISGSGGGSGSLVHLIGGDTLRVKEDREKIKAMVRKP